MASSTAPSVGFWKQHQQKIAPWIFLAPALIMFALFVVNPIIQSLLTSLTEWDGLGEKTWVGFANYAELFNDDLFYTSLKNNIIWLVLFLLAPPLGLAVALFLNQKVWGIRLVKSLFFFPFVISQVVVGLVFAWFYDPSFGLLAKLFTGLGLEPVPVLSDERWVTFGIIAAGLWPQTAYCMILYLTGLNNVNPEVLEAGKIDGAKGWTMLWHVVLPELRPATFFAIVVTVIGALRSFDLVAVMTAGGPFGSSNVLAYYMYEQALFNYRMGYGAAIATVLFLIMDVYIAFFLTRMIRQERASS
ncbi:MAG: carbohydrate ABC transporter permease [Geminicoccaceae bacterium]